jgi:predicted RNA-binding Zn-ribbon protein involved in translation (DUF1610 family)
MGKPTHEPMFAHSTKPPQPLDPLLRCDSCQAIVKLDTLHQLGVCPKCGNKRIRSVTILSVEERRKVADWGYEEFLTEFEPKEVAE